MKKNTTNQNKERLYFPLLCPVEYTIHISPVSEFDILYQKIPEARTFSQNNEMSLGIQEDGLQGLVVNNHINSDIRDFMF